MIETIENKIEEVRNVLHKEIGNTLIDELGVNKEEHTTMGMLEVYSGLDRIENVDKVLNELEEILEINLKVDRPKGSTLNDLLNWYFGYCVEDHKEEIKVEDHKEEIEKTTKVKLIENECFFCNGTGKKFELDSDIYYPKFNTREEAMEYIEKIKKLEIE